MKLTIKHLAPYLPYGLKGIASFLEDTLFTVDGIVKERIKGFSINVNKVPIGCMFYEFKPILRPLSDLTIEWVQKNIDVDLEAILINCEPENNHLSIEVTDKVLGVSAFSYEEYVLLLKNHFDVFGLIDAGLAIDINTI